MSIRNYNIITPDKKNYYYDVNKNLFIFRLNKDEIKRTSPYKYYLEVYSIDEETGEEYYYILLGCELFDTKCKQVNIDNYGRYKIKLHKQLRKYISDKVTNGEEIVFQLSDSDNNYDVFDII